ncbi:hypothetical protein JDV02_001841 [Purpureocillium takamizusanense]|uniref:Uncharacterized protein n=1 Tax=Purpureocillium takamizusanense TaxID=2060973 RepID=A0A9Q8Q9Y9_9HYPO|nr:uncharacterized protein JDV02_001841 [Purpureocillium takamizusanense]UNI15298.1 hypothetical protein JDV02_001841 [Purpureocillium takamizusanense]
MKASSTWLLVSCLLGATIAAPAADTAFDSDRNDVTVREVDDVSEANVPRSSALEEAYSVTARDEEQDVSAVTALEEANSIAARVNDEGETNNGEVLETRGQGKRKSRKKCAKKGKGKRGRKGKKAKKARKAKKAKAAHAHRTQ